MKRPTLSIIIPIFNSSSSISTIVNSILKQDFHDFELLLINDGSTDNSLEILHRLAHTDRRISIHSKENGGPSSARNFGLECAKGKYIQFYDSDDDILPEALNTTIKAAESSGADIVVSGWQINTATSSKPINPKECIVKNDLTNFVLESIGNDGTLYNLWNKLFCADIIRKNNLRFRDDVWFGEDLMFAFEYFKHANSLKIVSKITYIYNTGSDSSVFRTSSIIPTYRYANDKSLGEFVGENKTEKTQDLYQWIRWRWLLSYWMLVGQSNKSLKEKIILINQGITKGLVVAKNSHNIGRNKYILEKIVNYLIKHPFLALIFTRILSLIKRIML